MTEQRDTSSVQIQPSQGRLEAVALRVRPYVVQLRRNLRSLIAINAAVAITALISLLFFVKPYFDSAVVILPPFTSSGSGTLSQLSGLASLSGIGGLNLGSGISAEVYQNLLSSEAVLAPVFYHKYDSTTFGSPVNLIQYFEVEPDESVPPSLRERQMMLELMTEFVDSRLSVEIDRIGGIVTVVVRMPEARLATSVANQVAASLNRYIVEKNKETAQELTAYVEGRLEEGRDSLTLAENRLRTFQLRNRTIAMSPDLLLEQSRLARTVELKQSVFVELQRQYEISRIEQQKETPIVTFREGATRPVKKTGPRRLSILIAILMASALVTVGWSLFGRSLRHAVLVVIGRAS